MTQIPESKEIKVNMNKKIAGTIILTFLLANIFNLAFNSIPITTASDVINDQPRTPSNSDDLRPRPFERKWNFGRVAEWADFACVDDDSAELVVGVNNTRLENYAELVNVATEKGGTIVNKVSMGGKCEAVVVDLPFDVISSFVAEAQKVNLARYVEPNMKFQANLVPNDPNWTIQWGPKKIEADYAWNTTTGNNSILVAVIDTGMDYNHSDLAANYVALGYDWVNNDTDPLDDYGHGTHCAGIIAAVLNNSEGIAGMAQIQIMAEKALDADGGGREDDLANAIIHAVDQEADILSNSWSAMIDSELIHNAIEYAYDAGVLVIAAAGNDASSRKGYPAAYDEVVAVTATDESDNPAEFTSFGDWVEVAAPGVDIYSTMPMYHVTMNDDPYYKDQYYDNCSGTSMACPHVAGEAALIWSQFPNMTRDKVRVQLWYTADDLGAQDFDIYYGYGRINARESVEQAPADHDVLISNWEKPSFLRPGNTTYINTTVLNFGRNDESNVTVQLLVNDSLVDSTSIDFLANGTSETVSLPWTPINNGTYNVTSYVVPVPGETITKYNARFAYIPVYFQRTINVPDDYLTIQEAINAALHGDIINVSSGIYYENIIVDKTLTLFGENASTTIIDGNSASNVVELQANNVEINGFTIQNGTTGVYIDAWSNNRIIGNIIINIKIIGNEGVSGMFSSDNEIVNNTITSNYAIILALYSERNIISNNTIISTPEGINLVFCASYNNITGNTIRNSTGPWDASAIYLGLGANDNNIINNTVSNSTRGVWVGEQCVDQNCVGNTLINNTVGIQIKEASGSTFYHNNFINNTQQVDTDNSINAWDDGSEGNFWSDYDGTDADQDGIGDTPYVIDENNQDNYPLMAPWPPHDIAVTKITTLYDTEAVFPCWENDLNITVTVQNEGYYTENFTVTTYINNTLLGTENVTNLAPGANTTTPTYTWDVPDSIPYDYPYPIYVIKANVTAVPGEGETADNTLTKIITEQWPGDCNGDGHVNETDEDILGAAWYKEYPDPEYDPRADFNGDGEVKLPDLVKLAKNKGKGPLD